MSVYKVKTIAVHSRPFTVLSFEHDGSILADHCTGPMIPVPLQIPIATTHAL